MCWFAYGQPVLTSSNFPTISYSEIYEVTDLTNMNFESTGANQTWDFSQIPYEIPIYYNDFKEEVIPVSSAALSESFSGANFCIKATTGEGGIVNRFYIISDNQLEYIGYSIFSPKSSGSDYYQVHLDDTYVVFQLPYIFNTTFSDTYVTGISTPEINTYDAYGTLITPFHTYQNVIRSIRNGVYFGNESYTTYTWYNSSPFYEIMTVTVTFQSSVIVSMNARVLKNLTFLNNAENKFESEFSICPNPTSDILNIKIKNPQRNLSCSIYDLLGNVLLRNINLSKVSDQINLEDFQKGMYLIEIFDEHQIKLFTKKIIKK